MSEGTFKKVGKSTETLYGPRAMIVCGFSADDHPRIMDFAASIPLADMSVIFATDADGDCTLSEMIARPDQSCRGTHCSLARAIILAGITESELHRTLSAYRQSGLPRPLWATLTPYSENWALADLLAELAKERCEMENKNTSN